MTRLRVNAVATHALQQRSGLAWTTIHAGTEADCVDHFRRWEKHFPERECRVVTAEEARAESRRKPWSVKDPDHIPNGSKVIITVVDSLSEAQCRRFADAMGIADRGFEKRRGVVRRRRRNGDYAVRIDDSNWTVSAPRSGLIYPIPENVLPFERPKRRLG